MEPFFIKAILSGLMLVTLSGPLGCFVVFRRMAYFGDALAHAALLGIALALMLKLSVFWALVATGLVVALILGWVKPIGKLSHDSLLGIIAHGSLALGLVLLSLQESPVDINALLFGDILALTYNDLWLLFGAMCLGVPCLIYYWPNLLLVTVNRDIANVQGVNANRMDRLLLLLLALFVMLAMHVVGVLLVTALLIIPAATARPFAKNPEIMALVAIGIGIMAVLGGLGLSYVLDTVSGPSIIVVGSMLFIFSHLVSYGLCSSRRNK